MDGGYNGRLKAKKEVVLQLHRMQNDFSWNSSIPNLSTALPDSSLICIWGLPRFCIVQVCAHRERQRNRVKLKHYSPQLVQFFFPRKPVSVIKEWCGWTQCGQDKSVWSACRTVLHTEREKKKASRRERQRKSERPLPLSGKAHTWPQLCLWSLSVTFTPSPWTRSAALSVCNSMERRAEITHTSLFLIRVTNRSIHSHTHILAASNRPNMPQLISSQLISLLTSPVCPCRLAIAAFPTAYSWPTHNLRMLNRILSLYAPELSRREERRRDGTGEEGGFNMSSNLREWSRLLNRLTSTCLVFPILSSCVAVCDCWMQRCVCACVLLFAALC